MFSVEASVCLETKCGKNKLEISKVMPHFSQVMLNLWLTVYIARWLRNECHCVTSNFAWLEIRFWLYGRWRLVGLMYDFGCLDAGFWLCGRWNLVAGTLDFGCVDDGFWLRGCWILVVWALGRRQNVASNRRSKDPFYRLLSCRDVGFCLCWCLILVVWTLDFGYVDVEFRLCGCWILVLWALGRRWNVTSNRSQTVRFNWHRKHISVQRQICTLLQR